MFLLEKRHHFGDYVQARRRTAETVVHAEEPQPLAIYARATKHADSMHGGLIQIYHITCLFQLLWREGGLVTYLPCRWKDYTPFDQSLRSACWYLTGNGYHHGVGGYHQLQSWRLCQAKMHAM